MTVVNLLGATGSIGDSALSVIRGHHDFYKINAITAGSNVEKLAKIAIEFSSKIVAIADDSKYLELKSLLSSHPDIKIVAGNEGVLYAAQSNADITLSAIVGFAGLKPTIAAMKGSKTIALANKESLVCGGKLLLAQAAQHSVKIIPVDSEHNALFQVFEAQNAANVDRITITASGGALRDLTKAQMENVTPQMALKHPNWSMGPKITVDCATLANKGLEFIEAGMLFPVEPDKIDVLIHPQSIIHGMVHYSDGSVLAHLANPDMRVSIAGAFASPSRLNINYRPLDLGKLGTLSFAQPDYERFPMLQLAIECFKMGQDALITYNTANELAVGAFLHHQISFLDIYKIVAKCVHIRTQASIDNIEMVYDYNSQVILLAEQIIKSKNY